MKMNTIQDGMTLEILEECIDHYNQGLSFYEYINTKMKDKKLRNENFPSHISEEYSQICYI